LQVLIAASVHLACDALERYPDPLDPKKYYIRYSNNTFSHLTCVNELTFEYSVQLCVLKNTSCPSRKPVLRALTANQCGCETGFYCNSINSFTYCTYDGIKILNNFACTTGTTCLMNNTNPCV
jgi:hypothetical protein